MPRRGVISVFSIVTAGLRRAAERTNFSNEEINDGLFKTAFRAELQVGRHEERIRKFDGPVRVFVENQGSRVRTHQIAAIVKDIRARINHLDLAVTSDRKDANVVVLLVPTRNFARTICSRYGTSTASKIQNTLHPQCLSGIAKDESYRIRRAEVILPVDAGEFQFYDCAYEELLQSLGLINDDGSVPWTMFNDNVQDDQNVDDRSKAATTCKSSARAELSCATQARTAGKMSGKRASTSALVIPGRTSRPFGLI
jgi:hypothetical protein